MLSRLFSGWVFIHSPSHEKRAVIGIPSPELKLQIIKQNSPGTVVGMDGTGCFGQAVECDCWWRGSKPLLLSLEPRLMCLAWKILITFGRDVNRKGAFPKISFISILKFWAVAPLKITASLCEGTIFYFYARVSSIPSHSNLLFSWQASCDGERSKHIWPFKYIWSWIIIVDNYLYDK